MSSCMNRGVNPGQKIDFITSFINLLIIFLSPKKDILVFLKSVYVFFKRSVSRYRYPSLFTRCYVTFERNSDPLDRLQSVVMP